MNLIFLGQVRKTTRIYILLFFIVWLLLIWEMWISICECQKQFKLFRTSFENIEIKWVKEIEDF